MKQNILIMFDCFGVVSSCALLPYFSLHFDIEKAKEYNAHYSEIGDMGEISLMGMAKEMSEITKEDPQFIYDYWVNNTVVTIEMKNLLKELRKKYYVVLASNAMEGLVEDVIKKHGLEECFDKVFISYKYKDIKPNKSYFDRIINSFDTKFEKVILIDDYDKNITPLSGYGIIGIQYKNFKEAVEKLEEVLRE